MKICDIFHWLDGRSVQKKANTWLVAGLATLRYWTLQESAALVHMLYADLWDTCFNLILHGCEAFKRLQGKNQQKAIPAPCTGQAFVSCGRKHWNATEHARLPRSGLCQIWHVLWLNSNTTGPCRTSDGDAWRWMEYTKPRRLWDTVSTCNVTTCKYICAVPVSTCSTGSW